MNSKLKIIFQELFYALSSALLIFASLEFFWPRIVLAYINISLVLIIWLIIVIILVSIPERK
jgi:hypothetical protein